MTDHRDSPTFSGPFRLDDDFPAPTLEAWRQLAESSLRGRPLESLTVSLGRGVQINPLYTAADPVPESGVPGRPPFVRGSGRSDRTRCCALVDLPTLDQAAEAVAFERNRGAEAFWLRLASGHDSTASRRGVPAASADAMDRLLSGIDLGGTPVFLDAGDITPAAAAALLAVARRRRVTTNRLQGGFGIDPLGTLMTDGRSVTGLNRSFDLMSAASSWCLEHAPGLRAAGVSTLPYHHAGASETQELALALAAGAAGLRAMESGGIEPPKACRQIRFVVALGRDCFAETAKLRALRLLWSEVTRACGVNGDDGAAFIHAVSSSRNLTVRDPWVNLLRITVGAFAGMAGGADVLTTVPFDAPMEGTGALGRRMALNTQTILREECHLDQVIDPGGGAWYLESLTNDMAGAAWAQFQDIESRGGLRTMAERGEVAEFIAAHADGQRRAVATRKKPITGVSTWPSLVETPPNHTERPTGSADAGVDRARSPQSAEEPLGRISEAAKVRAGDPEIIDRAIGAADAGATLADLMAALAAGAEPVEVDPLPFERDAEPYERLRDAADAVLDRTGARPRVFLANLGPIAEHTARATWAKNFFEAGGIEAVGNAGFDSEEACRSAFEQSGAPVACLCSSDARYAEQAPSIARALKAAGATRIYLAGRPGENEAEFRRAGIDEFVFVGCNVLAILESLLGTVGGAS